VAFAALRPLRHRNFALLFSAGLVSNAGTWMQTVAVGALVGKLTGQAGWVGLVMAGAFLPLAVFGPIGGALADRVDRRRFLIAAGLLEAALASVLAFVVAAGPESPGIIVLIVTVQGCVTATRLPFLQAMLPDLVGPDDLLAGASLNAAQWNLGRVFGPALAGLVIAVGSFTWAIALNAISFFAVIIALIFVRGLPPLPDVPHGERLRDRIRDGARVAWAEPGCRAAISIMGAAAFLVAPFIGLLPAKALDVVGRARVEDLTSALTTAQGVGAVAGALTLASLAHRFGRRRMLLFSLTATPVAIIIYAATDTTLSSVLALALVGACYIGILSGLQTVVQLRAPTAYRARVLSFHTVALGAIYPIGTVVQGWAADRVGLQTVTTVGALGLLGVMAFLLVARPRVIDVLEQPADDVVAVEPIEAAP
jgi:MFS family permease